MTTLEQDVERLPVAAPPHAAPAVDTDSHAARATATLDIGSDHVLHLVLGATHTGLWTWDVATDLVRWSPETYAILGLEPGAFAGTGQAFFALVHADDRPRVIESVQSAVRERRLYVEEFRIVRPDGTVRWVTNRARPSYDAAGAPECVLGTISDVTDRHAAADDARREEERLLSALADRRFRTLADTAPAMLWVTDERNLCTFISRGWLEFTGQSDAEALGHGWSAAIHPDDRAHSFEVFTRAAARREPFDLDYRVRRADGEYRWAIDAGRPRFGLRGEYLGYIGSVIDVHERKLAEREVEHQAAIIEGISKGTEELIAAQDPDYRYVYFNDAYRRTFESLWGKELRAGTCMLEALADWPEEQAKARLLWRRAHAGETFSVAMDFGPTDATKRMFELRFNPVLDASGAQIGAAHIIRDVTDHVLTHRALRASEATLRAAADALQEADRRKDRFLATLSHELRNPLAPIRSAAQVLRSPRLEPQQLASVQAIIQRQVEHMAWLLDDLMDVARITSGKLVLKRRRTSLASAVDAAVEAARPLMDRKQHRLSITLPGDDVELDADPVRVAQILCNLLTNAAKYTDGGGHVRLVASREGDRVSIAVADDGIGIEADVLPGLFEMFAQADGAHARTEGGLGIGLALVKGLVELHGGSIDAYSEGSGRGSTFVVRLPLAPPGPAALDLRNVAV